MSTIRTRLRIDRLQQRDASACRLQHADARPPACPASARRSTTRTALRSPTARRTRARSTSPSPGRRARLRTRPPATIAASSSAPITRRRRARRAARDDDAGQLELEAHVFRRANRVDVAHGKLAATRPLRGPIAIVPSVSAVAGFDVNRFVDERTPLWTRLEQLLRRVEQERPRLAATLGRARAQQALPRGIERPDPRAHRAGQRGRRRLPERHRGRAYAIIQARPRAPSGASSRSSRTAFRGCFARSGAPSRSRRRCWPRARWSAPLSCASILTRSAR